jgi:hypothetical protein
MNGPPYEVGGAAAYALAATVWAIVAADSWRFRLASRPRSPLYQRAIGKRTVEAHGGGVAAARGAGGTGMTFELALPLEASAA